MTATIFSMTPSRILIPSFLLFFFNSKRCLEKKAYSYLSNKRVVGMDKHVGLAYFFHLLHE